MPDEGCPPDSASIRERVAMHEAQLEMIVRKLESIERKIDQLGYLIARTNSLEDEINELKREVSGLKQELTRVYSLYRWVIGLVATGFAGMIAVVLSLVH